MQELWLRKCKSFEEEELADFEFWDQMTGEERVAVLDEMRRDAWKIKGNRLEGLRKTVRVLKRPQR